MPILSKIALYGYKSIHELALELRPLNILIGANGAGKSNFISFFRFLHELLEENLRVYVATEGGTEAFLHFGQKTTPQLRFELWFDQSNILVNGYECLLTPSTADTFVFAREVAYFHNKQQYDRPYGTVLENGTGETQLNRTSETHQLAKHVRDALLSWRIYHFHDTSRSAPIKQLGDLGDNRFLRPDGSNLAAYLYLLRETERTHYHQIVEVVRLMAPFFRDFDLRPSPLNPHKIKLEWREQGTDHYFDAHALSDGTLRFICLATLLLQPPANFPSLILLDEPELGLHPYALHLLAELLQRTALDTQILLSTQSVTLVNQFAAEDIIVTERDNGRSTFHRLDQETIEHWLDEYGMGDLWEKNILGGRPTR